MRGLSDRGRILFLLAIVAGVAVVTAAMSIWLLYRTALDEGRSRLVETAQSQARLIEAVARFDAAHDHGDVPGGAGAATLSQITDAHQRYEGFGETGEFTLARREADEIVFLLSHRHYDLDTPKPVPWESSLAEPMRRALSGQSGTIIGLDYRDVLVLAAYEPVAELDFGIVAKIDMAEVRHPFLKAAGLSGLGVLLIVVLGAVAGRRIGNPMFERLRAEEALKASEAQLDEALEAMSEGFIYFDAEGQFIRCNSKHRELFPSHAEAMVPGARFEDLLRKQLENIRLPWAEGREEEWIAERLAQHRNPGAPVEQEFIDGRVIRLSEYKTKSGGTVSIRADITESKRVEEALRESEERFRRSVVDAPIPIIMHAEGGEVLMVSRKWTELSGYSLADIPTIPDWLERAYSGDRQHKERQAEIIYSLYEMKEPREHEALITTASGEKRLWEVRDAPLGRLADGRRYVISMIVDVTEREQAAAALKESEERFRVIAEASPVPLIITRRSDGEILYANPRVGPAFGLAADQIVGRSVTEFYGDPSGRDERLAALNEDGYVRDNEIEMQRADGSSISTIHSLQVIEYRGEEAVLGGFYDITERKRAEQELRQSEERFRDMTANVPGIVYQFRIDAAGAPSFPYVSPAIKDILGIEAADTVAEPDTWFDIIHPDDRPDLDASIEETHRTLDPWLWEGRMIRASGKTGWFRGSSTPRKQDDGSVLWTGLLLDITERKQAEEALRSSQSLLEKTFASLDDALFVVDPKTRKIVSCNPAVWRIFGYSDREVLGNNTDFIFKNKSAYVEFGAMMFPALNDQGTFHTEFEMRRKDGSVFPSEHSVTEIADESGERTAVISIVRDITERVQAEKELRESEERFRGIIENSPSAIILKDLEGRFQLVNSRFEEWYGGSAAKLIGKTSHDIHREEQAELYVAQDKEVIAAESARERERDIPFADGTLHSIIVTKFPVRDGTGRIVGVGTFNTDVTEHRKAEEQLRQAQKMEAVGQLTGGVAHDFNNLLAAILGHAEIAEDLLGKDDRSTQAIIAAAERGAELTQRLLAFSRRQSLDARPINLGDLIGGLHQLLQRTLGETIDIEISSAPSLWNAIADPGQLENALLNLAINARDAMPDGGKLTIETANLSLSESDVTSHMEVAPGDYVSLSVSDSGIGMSPEVVEQAFDPFFTTKDVGEGSGLGLSMVYGFAKQSGGDVTIESEPGQGTTVRLFLPRALESVERPTMDDRPSAPRGRGENVLVIEDDPDVRVMAEKMLENLGYRVWSAENARAGLDILQAEPSMDLMLSDVVLSGGMSGPDMAERARAFRPEIKVLFMSGHAEQSIHLRTPLPEGSDLLDKPFRTIELAQRVRAVLDR